MKKAGGHRLFLFVVEPDKVTLAGAHPVDGEAER
jgi:hypothetical protein